MTTRNPKGTPVGGRFAQERKPDGVDFVGVVEDTEDEEYKERYCGYCKVEGHNFAHCSRRDIDGIAIGVDSDDFHEDMLTYRDRDEND